MRTLPAASLEFTKKQLLIRLRFYGFKENFQDLTKPAILEIIERVETVTTREIT